jgi:pimeloyl-ACP methyl ester carboxylesterase
VIVGEHDAVTPPTEAEAMAVALPDAALTIVPAAGHMSPIEQPEAVNDALRVLLARSTGAVT